MGDAVLIAAAVASAGASIMSGMQQKKAADLEATQYEEERRNAQTAAEQDEAERRRELARTLATQDAIRAGRGVELYSQTAMNIREQSIEAAEDDINTSRLNYLNQQRRLGLGASASRARGSGAMLGGVASASSTLLSAARTPSAPKEE